MLLLTYPPQKKPHPFLIHPMTRKILRRATINPTVEKKPHPFLIHLMTRKILRHATINPTVERNPEKKLKSLRQKKKGAPLSSTRLMKK